MAERWTLAAGEYAFYNGGAWLGDVPVARLFEISYFLAHREYVRRIDTEEVARARVSAANRLDDSLRGTDETTGLPVGLGAFGIKPADAS